MGCLKGGQKIFHIFFFFKKKAKRKDLFSQLLNKKKNNRFIPLDDCIAYIYDER